MNNRERVLAALNFAHPDYTPYAIGFTGQMLDRMIAHTGNPDYTSTINNHITVANTLEPQVEICPEYFRDEYGVVWNKTGVDKDIGVVDQYLIQDIDDLEAFEFPSVNEAYIRAQVEAVLAAKPDNFRMADLGFSLFERAWTLRGMENLLCDMIAEPEFVHALMQKILERNLKVLDVLMEYDIDGVLFGDDWGQQRGLIMGPRCWREFIKPYLKQMYARVRGAGKVVAQHSCGDIREIMDDLYEIGLQVYQTFQPEIYGYDYAKKIYGRITIWGGVSSQRHLPVLSPEGVKDVVREMLKAFPDGGLIAAPTHDVPGDVPPENIIAMLEALENQL